LKPIMVASPAAAAGITDEQLVAAARTGSDEAFEVLFRRYRERVTAQVRGIVHDYGRSEDIVQEAFISALRSLRATDREIVFRPWIQQIARNACIDHLRRVRRTEEISIDSAEFMPDFEIRISHGTLTDIKVLQREDFDDLRQAFGGLPPSQHQIMVLRELEGLSYKEIGRRMRLTPAAVESMLARARRTLKDHYEEIKSGERCRRMRPVIAAAAGGLAGKRDRYALERHVRHCRQCRQEALLMGLEDLVSNADRASRAASAFSKAAAWLPLPALFRRRPPEGADAASAVGGNHAVHAHTALSNFGAMGSLSVDHASTALQKAAAVVAVAAVAGGGGYAAREAGVPLPLPKPITAGTNDSKSASKESAKATPSSGSAKAEERSGSGTAPAEAKSGSVAPTDGASVRGVPAGTSPTALAPGSRAGAPAGVVPLDAPSADQGAEPAEQLDPVAHEASPVSESPAAVAPLPAADVILDAIGVEAPITDGGGTTDSSGASSTGGGEVVEPLPPIQELLPTDPLSLPLPIELGL
jgi:RNA polymerase sigma factor (sigma-70 family)